MHIQILQWSPNIFMFAFFSFKSSIQWFCTHRICLWVFSLLKEFRPCRKYYMLGLFDCFLMMSSNFFLCPLYIQRSGLMPWVHLVYFLQVTSWTMPCSTYCSLSSTMSGCPTIDDIRLITWLRWWQSYFSITKLYIPFRVQ